MHLPFPLNELASLQAVRHMVAQHLMGSRQSTDAVLATMARLERRRIGADIGADTDTGANASGSYWQAGSGAMLPFRASVVEEIARLHRRLDGVENRID